MFVKEGGHIMSERQADRTPLLVGRVALIAGASRGIGAVTARAFAEAGAAVVLAARDQASLEAVAQEIRQAGGRAVAVPTDVGDATLAERLVQTAIDTFGRLDAAFNNATDGPPPAPLADIDPAGFDRALRGNVRATFLGMKYQIKAMLRTGGGAIVNMASVAGVHGVANLAGYVAGKAGIIALTKVAALDYADQGIRVNVVAPGPILTHHLLAAGEEAQRQAGQATPMRRVGQPREVAAAVVWLCSDEASYITGATLPIDGGQTAGIKPPQFYRQGVPMSPPKEEESHGQSSS
jgi:NAD(P)-dependent dehydrogenase (short-subunit alcohol dehydrogenase family)